jgi:tRNA uridine 5-carboxymethylaminomethyl modification enzyme
MIDDALVKRVSPPSANAVLVPLGEEAITESATIGDLARRPNVSLRELLSVANVLPESILDEHGDAVHRTQTAARYAGYITKQQRDLERFKEYENKLIPSSFSYDSVSSLSSEGREKLRRIRPSSLGQASRIAGVSASDVSILAVYLK